MNILPLVTAFILLFALCSYTLLQQYISVSHESFKIRAAHRIERQHLSEIDRLAYRRHRNKNPEAKPSNKSETAEYISPRTFFPCCAIV